MEACSEKAFEAGVQKGMMEIDTTGDSSLSLILLFRY